MTDFIAIQKRCRELEHRIGRVHQILVGKRLPKQRHIKAEALIQRLTREWEEKKQLMAHQIFASRYGSHTVESGLESENVSHWEKGVRGY